MVMVKVYPKYKDSGAPWFGEVPSHWQTLRLGSVLRERKETNKANDVTKILSVMKDIGVIPYEEKGRVGNKCSEDITRYKIVRPGDIVANCMNIIIGSVGLSKYTGCLSPVYYVLTPRSQEDDSRFFDYVFKIKSFQLSLVRLGNGILAHRMRIPMELLKCETVPKPPAEEQRVIVEYLGSFNKIFRRYIREKQKTIKLLNEQKQAVINRAITKGINPNVRLKSSGFGWMGDAPKHWEVRRLKNFLLEPLKYGANEAAELTDRTPPRYIRITDIDKNGNLVDSSFRSLPIDIAEPYLLQEGDILLARSGATVGKSFLYFNSYGSSAYAGYLIRARINPNIVSFAFFYNYLQSSAYWTWVSLMTIQATIQNVSAEKYGCLPVPVPPCQEQELILKKIANDCRPFDELICASHKDIEFMREYRIRLISDVVTGKIDVRDIKLPEIEDITDSEQIEEREISEDLEDTEEVVNADE